jgi:uncharacterized damage-inducible protein DinB
MNARDELARLGDQLRRSFEGPAWHGPAVLEILDGVDDRTAAARPIAGAHSIWELVLHLGATYGLVLRRLRGDAAPLTPAEDWPAVPEPTATTWRASVDELRARHRALHAAVQEFDPARLAEPLVPEPPYSAYVQFVGVTQHDLYHAGQMALLKRAAAGGTPRNLAAAP